MSLRLMEFLRANFLDDLGKSLRVVTKGSFSRIVSSCASWSSRISSGRLRRRNLLTAQVPIEPWSKSFLPSAECKERRRPPFARCRGLPCECCGRMDWSNAEQVAVEATLIRLPVLWRLVRREPEKQHGAIDTAPGIYTQCHVILPGAMFWNTTSHFTENK